MIMVDYSSMSSSLAQRQGRPPFLLFTPPLADNTLESSELRVVLLKLSISDSVVKQRNWL